MKTEERHRLQEHDLRKLTLKAGEFWNRHGLKVLAGLLALVLVGVAAIIWTVSSNSAAAEGWTKMARSGNAEQFIAIAEDYEGEAVGHWARLRAAELHLMEGVEQAFSNRGAAIDELEESVAQFAKLVAADLPSDRLSERALYGHARSLEALAAVVEPAEGEASATLDDAIAAYDKLLKTYPETLYKPIVEEQIKALKAERTQQFVAWFQRQEPKPSDRALPQDGVPFDPGTGVTQPPGASAAPSQDAPAAGATAPASAPPEAGSPGAATPATEPPVSPDPEGSDSPAAPAAADSATPPPTPPAAPDGATPPPGGAAAAAAGGEQP